MTRDVDASTPQEWIALKYLPNQEKGRVQCLQSENATRTSMHRQVVPSNTIDNHRWSPGSMPHPGFAPPPLSLLALPPPCEDELYNVASVKQALLLQDFRLAEQSTSPSYGSSSRISLPSRVSRDGRPSERRVKTTKPTDLLKRPAPDGDVVDDGGVLGCPFTEKGAAMQSCSSKEKRASSRELPIEIVWERQTSPTTMSSSASLRPAWPASLTTGKLLGLSPSNAKPHTRFCRKSRDALASHGDPEPSGRNSSSCPLPTSSGTSAINMLLHPSQAEQHVANGADELWNGTTAPMDAFMDILRKVEGEGSDTAKPCKAIRKSSSFCIPSDQVESHTSMAKNKLKSWLRNDRESCAIDDASSTSDTSISKTFVKPAAEASADAEGPGSTTSIWPIDESLPDEAYQPRAERRTSMAKKRDSPSGIFWAGAAQRIWGLEFGHRHRQRSNKIMCNGESALPDLLPLALNASLAMENIGCNKQHYPREELLSPDTPQLRSWSAFENAYMNGLLELSDRLRKPSGVPLFPCCPDATPLDTGFLAAPQPPWELQRLRTVYRMDLFDLPLPVCSFLADVMNTAAHNLGVHTIMVHVFDRDALFRLSKGGFKYADRARVVSLAGHMILNRNNGMIVPDLQSDWRFKGSHHCYFRFYNGVPILASNGLPIASICAVDPAPHYKLDLTLHLRRLAIFIGSIFEAYYRYRWSNKVCAMSLHLHQLRHLLLLEDTFSDAFQLMAAKEGQADGADVPALTNATAKTAEPIDDLYEPQAVVDLGLYLTSADARSLRSVLSTSVADTGLELACLLLVQMDDTQATLADAAILCLHRDSSDGENAMLDSHASRSKLGYTASPRFLQMLFEGCCTNTSKIVGPQDVSLVQGHILRQNTCPATERKPDMSYRTNPKVPSSGTWIEFSEEEERMQRMDPAYSHPVQSRSSRRRSPFRASLTIRVARRGRLGLALSLLTLRDDKIIGVEDLRYVEALRPFLASAFYKYTMQDDPNVEENVSRKERDDASEQADCNDNEAHNLCSSNDSSMTKSAKPKEAASLPGALLTKRVSSNSGVGSHKRKPSVLGQITTSGLGTCSPDAYYCSQPQTPKAERVMSPSSSGGYVKSGVQAAGAGILSFDENMRNEQSASLASQASNAGIEESPTRHLSRGRLLPAPRSNRAAVITTTPPVSRGIAQLTSPVRQASRRRSIDWKVKRKESMTDATTTLASATLQVGEGSFSLERRESFSSFLTLSENDRSLGGDSTPPQLATVFIDEDNPNSLDQLESLLGRTIDAAQLSPLSPQHLSPLTPLTPVQERSQPFSPPAQPLMTADSIRYEMGIALSEDQGTICDGDTIYDSSSENGAWGNEQDQDQEQQQEQKQDCRASLQPSPMHRTHSMQDQISHRPSPLRRRTGPDSPVLSTTVQQQIFW